MTVTVDRQVAVPLVQVALVGGAVQDEPVAVVEAEANTPLTRFTVAVEPEHESLNPERVTVPVPDRPEPVMPVTVATPPVAVVPSNLVVLLAHGVPVVPAAEHKSDVLFSKWNPSYQ